MEKPIVMYRPSTNDVIQEGTMAFLARGCVDHPSPRVNNREHPVYTSKVIKKDGLYFETLNTRYIPQLTK